MVILWVARFIQYPYEIVEGTILELCICLLSVFGALTSQYVQTELVVPTTTSAFVLVFTLLGQDLLFRDAKGIT